ncbi:hypothetical protein HanPI659440_Chr15g0590261 [Helianthus annuus]|nr:hypothetical protein HanPI659440_Chr15g0590261 [Helianthus annuus]
MFQLQILTYWLLLLLLQRSLRSDHSLYIAWRQKKSLVVCRNGENSSSLCHELEHSAMKKPYAPTTLGGLEDAYYLCEAITLPARKELHFPDFSVLCQQAKRVFLSIHMQCLGGCL